MLLRYMCCTSVSSWSFTSLSFLVGGALLLALFQRSSAHSLRSRMVRLLRLAHIIQSTVKRAPQLGRRNPDRRPPGHQKIGRERGILQPPGGRRKRCHPHQYNCNQQTTTDQAQQAPKKPVQET